LKPTAIGTFGRLYFFFYPFFGRFSTAFPLLFPSFAEQSYTGNAAFGTAELGTLRL
jgi:hypothetical protein